MLQAYYKQWKSSMSKGKILAIYHCWPTKPKYTACEKGCKLSSEKEFEEDSRKTLWSRTEVYK